MNSALAPAQQQPASSELAAALGACRRAFVATAVFSGMSNLLMLTGALFMLEVYDRILPSRSVPTLVALLFLVAGLYAAQGMIDTIRSRILVRVGHSLDESMSGRVYDAIVRLPLKIGGRGEGTQPIRDLDNVRSFLSGSGPVAFFDLPWMPVYLAICFLFHTLIGLTALFGAIVLVALTIVTEIKTRHPTRSAAQFAVARNALLEASRRNAEAITAMGMVGRIAKHWHELNRNFVATSGRASDVGGGLGAASKVLRLLLAQQSAKDKGIALTEQELQGVRDLWQKNLVQLNRLTSLQRDEARLEGERGQIIAQAAEVKGKIAEIQLQIIQVDQDLSSDVAKELREIDSKIGEYVERKITAEDQLKRTDIRAPQDGTVFQSTANTVGGVIAAGDPIMLIVPESDNLTVEVRVDPKDIDQIQLGQIVVLRFTSFNVRTTPEIDGTVSRIAADTSTDQRTGQSYYLVRIAMPVQELKRLGDVKLTPGMPVEAFVQTGDRTMLSYLIKPLHDQLMRAFREK
jgi:HlyD family type I secretion membrane fusion protein